MKHIALILLMILAWGTTGYSDSISTDQTTYFNDQAITIEGTSQSQVVILKATIGEKTVFEKKITVDTNQSYSYTHQTDYLEPTGEWKLTINGTNPIYIQVKPTLDSATLVLSVTSPSPGQYRKTQTIPISVQVTKNHQPVSNATIVFWTTDGNRVGLTEKENGFYSSEYTIPAHAKTGKWNFFVSAKALMDQNEFGGWIIQEIEIQPAAIKITPLQPVFPVYNLGEKIILSIEPRYQNTGQTVQTPHISATLGEQQVQFSPQPDGSFTAQIETQPSATGEQILEILANDDHNNSGRFVQTIVIGGTSNYYLNQYGWIAAILAISFLIALHLLLSKRKRSQRIDQLEKEKQQVLTNQKILQEKYFKTQSIDTAAFEDQSIKLAQKLTIIEEKMKQLKETK